MIEVDDLRKRYRKATAVDGLSFSVPAGRITGFLGPNGAGKTRTLRILLGLVQPTSGTATIDGRKYREIEDPVRHGRRGARGLELPPEALRAQSLRDARGRGRASRAARVDEVLELVGLGNAAGRAVGGYSLGMRQRLSVAGALLGEPALLVLDEPANGLDPEGIRWLRDFLRSFAADGRDRVHLQPRPRGDAAARRRSRDHPPRPARHARAGRRADGAGCRRDARTVAAGWRACASARRRRHRRRATAGPNGSSSRRRRSRSASSPPRTGSSCTSCGRDVLARGGVPAADGRGRHRVSRSLRSEWVKLVSTRLLLWIAMADLALVVITSISIAASSDSITSASDDRSVAQVAGICRPVRARRRDRGDGRRVDARDDHPDAARDARARARVRGEGRRGGGRRARAGGRVRGGGGSDHRAGAPASASTTRGRRCWACWWRRRWPRCWASGSAPSSGAREAASPSALIWLLVGENLMPLISHDATRYAPGRAFAALASGSRQAPTSSSAW